MLLSAFLVSLFRASEGNAHQQGKLIALILKHGHHQCDAGRIICTLKIRFLNR